MEELKKSLKSLDSPVKLIIWGGLAVVCFVLFGVLKIYAGKNGFKMLTEATDLYYGSILMIMATIFMLILPLFAILLALLKKRFVALPAYLYAGVAFFILVFFDFKLVEGIYWLTFVLSVIWAFLSYLLNGDKVDFTTQK